MTKDEKLIWYATAPRAYTQKIHQFIDGDFVPFWISKLRGIGVETKQNGYKFKSKQEALDNAKMFRQSCINEAKEKGLLR